MSYATELAEAVLKDPPDSTEIEILAGQVLATEEATKRIAQEFGGTYRPVEALIMDRHRLRLEACLLARAWRDRQSLSADEITRYQIDALAEQHYSPGEFEPARDTPMHPWRMTSELAEALTRLATGVAFHEQSPTNATMIITEAQRIAELLRLQVKP